MQFSDLLNSTIKLDKRKIAFDFCRDRVNTSHAGFGEIKVQRITYPTPNDQAFFRLLGEDRTSVYDEPFMEAEIRYCSNLDNHPRQQRYALTKELCHVFDAESERTDTKEKFVQLLRDIQNQPSDEDASPMYLAEKRTRWQAIMLLCPKKFRDQLKPAYDSQKLKSFEVADDFEIPEWVVPFLMDDYFDEIYERYSN